MNKDEFEKMLKEYLSECTLSVDHDNGDSYYGTAKIEVRLESPGGETIIQGTAYTSTFEKAKSAGDW